jgi:hypothetical protein
VGTYGNRKFNPLVWYLRVLLLGQIPQNTQKKKGESFTDDPFDKMCVH